MSYTMFSLKTVHKSWHELHWHSNFPNTHPYSINVLVNMIDSIKKSHVFLREKGGIDNFLRLNFDYPTWSTRIYNEPFLILCWKGILPSSLLFLLSLGLFQINHALKVLGTDAVFTLLTWLPFTIFQIISTNYVLQSTTETLSNDIQTIKLMYRIQGALTVMLFTNCFSSPVIYFCFNKAFRVSV